MQHSGISPHQRKIPLFKITPLEKITHLQIRNLTKKTKKLQKRQLTKPIHLKPKLKHHNKQTKL